MSGKSKEPEWVSLSHHEKYRHLDKVRRDFCSEYQEISDTTNDVYILNGQYITDVPSFYLSLGEAINGSRGYFGSCLDSLSDCLCGRFGAKPPFTIQISKSGNLASCLDEKAWVRVILEHRLRLFEDEDLSVDYLREVGIDSPIELTGESYLDALSKLFAKYDVKFELLR